VDNIFDGLFLPETSLKIRLFRLFLTQKKQVQLTFSCGCAIDPIYALVFKTGKLINCDNLPQKF